MLEVHARGTAALAGLSPQCVRGLLTVGGADPGLWDLEGSLGVYPTASPTLYNV